MKPATLKTTFLQNWQEGFLNDIKDSLGDCATQHMETHKTINEPTVNEDSLYFNGMRKLRDKSELITTELSTLVNWAKGTINLRYFPSMDERSDVVKLAVKVDKHFGELASLYRDMQMHTPVLKETADMTYNIKLSVNFLNKFLRHMR